MPETGRARSRGLKTAIAFLRKREAWLPSVLSVLVCLLLMRGAHLPYFSP